MRISGRGSSGGFGSPSERDRGRAFRRRHRVGERLSGRILRHEAEGLAWVDFQGIELLARIESRHEPGTALLFQVLRLEPDILLQELAVARAHGDPLVPAVDGFWLARSHFETRAGALLTPNDPPPAPDARKRAFFAALDGDQELAAAWKALETTREAASALTAARGAGRLDYRPWLLPGARSGEMLFRERPRVSPPPGEPATLAESAFSFSYPRAGQCEVLLWTSGSRASARLHVEHPEAADALVTALSTLAFPGLDAEFTPTPLPLSARAGLLAPLLSAGPQGGPRFSVQV